MYRIALPRLLSISLLSFASVVFFAVRAQAQTFTLEALPSADITFGEPLTIKVKLTPASGATIPPIDSIEWVGIEGALRIKSKSAEGTDTYSFVFETLKASDPFEITAKVEGYTGNKLTVSIAPQVTASNLDLTSPNFTTSATDATAQKLIVKQQADAVVALKLVDNKAFPADALKAVSNTPEIASAVLTNSRIVVTGRTPGTANVTISSNGKEIKSFDVQVTETIKEIKADNRKFTKGVEARKPLAELGIQVIGRNNTTWTGSDAVSKLNFRSTNPNAVDISTDGTELVIRDVGVAQLEISDKEDAGTVRLVTIEVVPKAASIRLDTGDNTPILENGKKTVRATVIDESEREVPNVAVVFACEGDNCDAVTVVNKANNFAEITGIRSTAAPVKIVAKAAGVPNVEFLVRVIGANQITDFRPLLIRMDMLPEQMAKDLFGRKASDEFYIAKVNLFNKIRKTDTEYFGDSILVYSESLQVRVAMEVRCKDGGAVSECAGNSGQWIPVTAEMIKKYFNQRFSLSPYSYISATEARSRPTDADKCFIDAPLGFVGLYRPFSYETVAVTHDRRDERTLRSRILTVVNGAISFTSFVTAIAVPGGSSDLPLGLEKSNALLLPSFEKLFPSMKEVQRQNVLTMVMRQLEEIPFGGNIERKIFFPKGSMDGLWPGHKVRISAVSTFDACAQAAIVKKVGQQ